MRRSTRAVHDTVHDKLPRFPPHLCMHVSMSECSLSEPGKLLFREGREVPDSEPLRTQIMQESHDSAISSHPGREAMTSKDGSSGQGLDRMKGGLSMININSVEREKTGLLRATTSV